MPHHAQKTVKAAVFAALLFLSFVFSNCRMSQQNQNSQYATSSNNVSSNSSNDPLTIHRRAISIDMHADTTQRMVDEHLDINQRLTDGQLDAVRMKEGGLDAQFFSIWVEPQLYGGGGESAIKRADEQINAVRAMVEKHADTWELATTAADVRRIVGGGKLAALMGLEGGYAIDER